jgi:hypothetical protein
MVKKKIKNLIEDKMRGKFKKDHWITKFSKLFDPVYYGAKFKDLYFSFLKLI